MSDRDQFAASCRPTRRRVILAGLGALAAAAPFRTAMAQSRVVIQNGEIAPTPIAIPAFLPGGPDDTDVANGIAQVIRDNLARSGMFAPIDPSAFPERIADIDTAPQLDGWRKAKAQALVVGQAKKQDDGQIQVGFRLWDIDTGQDMVDKAFSAPPQNWRRIAHIISDQIYTRLTGEQGYFDSRVVFVDESGPADRRIKRLALMDQDGANLRYLTRGAELVLTPRFSPSSQAITYMQFGQDDPQVCLYNLDTGQRDVVGNFPGMSFAPRFSPDGQSIIMRAATPICS